MKRDDILRGIGAVLMFAGGFAGAQSMAWGWTTAIIGCGLMLLVIWLQNRKK
ncbi:MAG: hypothetical protein KA260_15135 [Burkholderiales bacterium]|jgi:hypothetical protein|nr:hypothetical protein [Burkholderiales bacterium]